MFSLSICARCWWKWPFHNPSLFSLLCIALFWHATICSTSLHQDKEHHPHVQPNADLAKRRVLHLRCSSCSWLRDFSSCFQLLFSSTSAPIRAHHTCKLRNFVLKSSLCEMRPSTPQIIEDNRKAWRCSSATRSVCVALLLSSLHRLLSPHVFLLGLKTRDLVLKTLHIILKFRDCVHDGSLHVSAASQSVLLVHGVRLVNFGS